MSYFNETHEERVARKQAEKAAKEAAKKRADGNGSAGTAAGFNLAAQAQTNNYSPSTDMVTALAALAAKDLVLEEVYLTKEGKPYLRGEFEDFVKKSEFGVTAERSARLFDQYNQKLIDGYCPPAEDVKAYLDSLDAKGLKSLCGASQAADAQGQPASLPAPANSGSATEQSPAEQPAGESEPNQDTRPNFVDQALSKKGFASGVTLASLTPDQVVEVSALAKKLEEDYEAEQVRKKEQEARKAFLADDVFGQVKDLSPEGWKRFQSAISVALASTDPSGLEGIDSNVAMFLKWLEPGTQNAMAELFRDPSKLSFFDQLKEMMAGKEPEDPPTEPSGSTD